MTRRLYCTRHLASHVTYCPRCLEEENERLEKELIYCRQKLDYQGKKNERLRAELADVKEVLREAELVMERKEARIDVALALHGHADARSQEVEGRWCLECESGTDWPCPTVKALRPEPTVGVTIDALRGKL